MNFDAAFDASRFLHFSGALWLFGAAVFPLYTRSVAHHVEAMRRLRATLFLAALAALLGGIAWFVFAAAEMAGDFASLASPATWNAIFGATDFGPLWASRLVLIVLIAVFLRRWPASYARNLVSGLSALVLASLAGTGHARTTEGWQGALHMTSDALHLIAAGAWLGGLVGLAILIARGPRGDAAQALAQFSGVGYAAVAVLVASGSINGWFLVGSIDGLIYSRYGQLLLLKLALFAGMLAHAGLNRFRLVPALLRESGDGASAALPKLRRNVLAEQLLGTAVIVAVSVLGTMPTPTGS